MSIVIESYDEECFIIRAPGKEDSIISGNFDCLDDELDPRPIRVRLYGPNKQKDQQQEQQELVWSSPEGISEASFIITGRGRYQLCISNDPQYVRETIQINNNNNNNGGDNDDQEEEDDELEEDRKIGFSIRVHPILRGHMTPENNNNNNENEAEEPPEEGPDEKRTYLLLEMSNSIYDGLNLMEDHQDYLKFRESLHIQVTERTIRNVIMWTMIEALVLVVISIGQVFYLKKFFETRQYI